MALVGSCVGCGAPGWVLRGGLGDAALREGGGRVPSGPEGGRCRLSPRPGPRQEEAVGEAAATPAAGDPAVVLEAGPVAGGPRGGGRLAPRDGWGRGAGVRKQRCRPPPCAAGPGLSSLRWWLA